MSGSALLAASLAEKDSEILVNQANEIPYIEINLAWMRALGVSIEVSDDFNHYHVKAGHTYPSFDRPVPGDFSSAAFFLVGGAVAGSQLKLSGLDMQDVQGDRILVDILQDMGADIKVIDNGRGGIIINGWFLLKRAKD